MAPTRGGFMSADNGIYIAKFTDGYRVTHAQAIDNCFYGGDCSEEAKAFQYEYFKDSKVYIVREEAWGRARELSDEILTSEWPVLEYGVNEISFDHDFPTRPEAKAEDDE